MKSKMSVKEGLPSVEGLKLKRGDSKLVTLKHWTMSMF